MNFDYLEEHEILSDAARGFLVRSDPIDLVKAEGGGTKEARRDAWLKAADQGWAAVMSQDPDYFGATIVEAMVIAEELGRAAFGGPFLASNAVTWAISKYGTDELRSELLADVSTGKTLCAWAAYQAGSGWDGASPQAMATQAGDDYTVSGKFSLVQDADIADYLLLSANSERGVVSLLVPTIENGVTIRRAKTIDVTRSLCDVELSDVSCPVGFRISPPSQTLEMQQDLFRFAVILTCADSVGLAARLHEMILDYSKERIAFGKPIASFQAIKHRVADMLVFLETARVTTWNASVCTRDEFPDRDEAVSNAKFYVTAAASRIAAESLQLHGAIGFTWEHNLHLFLKRAKANEVLWGGPAWHKERVAKMLQL